MRDKDNDILVSIDCLVYNHELYLRKCLEGILMQKTSFKYVAIVHDDASNDGSASIICEYVEKYPDIIKPIFETENKYSLNDGTLQNIMYKAHKESGAKYIAICEGDDYWTDPLKLQKQVDFLESHLEYSVCWHNFVIFDTNSQKFIRLSNKKVLYGNGADVNEYDFFHGLSGGQPLTMVYRFSSVDPSWYSRYTHMRDTHLIYSLLRNGKGYILNFEGAVYNSHDDSVVHSLSKYEFSNISFTIFGELYRDFPDDDVLESYFKEVIMLNYTLSLKVGKLKHFYLRYIKILGNSPFFFTKILFSIFKMKFLMICRYHS